MKTINYFTLILFALLFTQCESKWTKFTVNKESLGGEFIMKSQDAYIDTIINIDASLRSKLDIPDDAKINDVTIKNVKINFEALPGHISQRVNITVGVVTLTGGEYKCVYLPDQELLLNQYSLTGLAEGFILFSEGIADINKYITGVVQKTNPIVRRLRVKVSPINTPGKPINMKFTLNFGFTVNYTDCFVTGNIGDDECK